jgi:hypothetical protein
MKFSYKFSNLCGTVYKQGNVLFTPDGNSVLSPVGNRISIFDLVKYVVLSPAHSAALCCVSLSLRMFRICFIATSVKRCRSKTV